MDKCNSNQSWAVRMENKRNKYVSVCGCLEGVDIIKITGLAIWTIWVQTCYEHAIISLVQACFPLAVCSHCNASSCLRPGGLFVGGLFLFPFSTIFDLLSTSPVGSFTLIMII